MKMERLVELLNEYAKECDSEIVYVDYDKDTHSFEVLSDGKVEYLWEETILCFRFWFIDWLFDRQYIDENKCMEDEDYRTLVIHYDSSYAALMCLALKYNAIDLLIYRLK